MDQVVNISDDVVTKFIAFYEAHKEEVNTEEYTHFLMYDADVHNGAVGNNLPGTSFVHGNILWHKSGIPPHVDICGKGNTHSVIIPLIVENPNQKLIVFDQTFDQECTWLGDLVTDLNPDRSYGSDRPEPPYKTPGVLGCTNEPCPDELLEHLPTYYGPDMYFGLSGTLYDYEVGTAIIFDSNKIHTTGIMDSPKVCATSFVVYEDA